MKEPDLSSAVNVSMSRLVGSSLWTKRTSPNLLHAAPIICGFYGGRRVAVILAPPSRWGALGGSAVRRARQGLRSLTVASRSAAVLVPGVSPVRHLEPAECGLDSGEKGPGGGGWRGSRVCKLLGVM